jgi:hypothetical protein
MIQDGGGVTGLFAWRKRMFKYLALGELQIKLS